MVNKRIFTNCHMDGYGETHRCCSCEVAIFSSRAPDGDRINGDSAALFCMEGNAGVFVVADGMGGLSHADRASATVVRAIENALMENTAAPTFREAMLNGIEEANRRVRQLGAGSTLAAVEINDNTLRSYHIGDAAILVTGQRGRIKLQTISHSPVGYAVEAGFLDEEEAMHHEDRHLLLNMLGSSDMRIEIGPPIPLARRDTVLLASDGLFDNLHVAEIVDIIRKGPIGSAMEGLVRACRARMHTQDEDQPSKPDDLTLILLRRCP
ncbi:MAG TPA: serine/threonine protein phosphatase [Gammaproteobacteria bacterium]|nr:serine/threonine protein phosphatase [Gammaproteobacteria bacterium]